MSAPRSRVDVLLPLRGIASFAVAWFHFTHGTPWFLADGWLKTSGEYGWLGVEMFFVISGFVIPWSLYQGGYQRREHWRHFIAKRVIRLDPPYLTSIALVLCATWLASQSSSFRGLPVSQQVSWGQLLAHLGYANAILDYEWLNLVYWTLAIEAMYYVLIGWGFPYLQRPNSALAVYLVIGAAPFLIPDERWIFHYLPLFGIGIASFQFATTDPRLNRWIVQVVGLTILSAVTLTIPMALAALRQLSASSSRRG